MKKTCAVCGKEFEAYRKAKYCSEECRRLGRYKSQRERDAGIHDPIKCAQCGKEFTVRTKYGKDRLLCYECMPEKIDDDRKILIRELNPKLQKKARAIRQKELKLLKIEILEKKANGIDEGTTDSDQDSRQKIYR